MRNSTRLTLAAITLLGGVTLANAQTTTGPGAPHPGMSPPAAMPGMPMTPPGGTAGTMPMMGMDKMMTGGAGPRGAAGGRRKGECP